MIHIILIRHGRTAWNVRPGHGRRFRGLVDVPLDAEGESQARLTAERLADEPLNAVYASPLQRASRTAQLIAQPHGLTAQALPGLTSMNYGDWAGLTTDEVGQRWPDLHRLWLQDPFQVQVPGGESLEDIRQRATTALSDILSRHSDDETLVLVSHQVVTRTLICTLARMPDSAWWRFGQDLCALNRLGYDPQSGQFTLLGLNDTCHLAPSLPTTDGPGARFILVRHGQTAWNAGAGEERFRGRTDLPLDEVGQSQARAVARRLRSEPVTAIYTSPLLRTQQTIAPLADQLGLLIQPHPGLNDIDYGRFQGLTHSQAAAAYPDLYAAWRRTPARVRFPGGEGLVDLQGRLLTLLEELEARHPGQTVVLVGHQIVNKVLPCTLLGIELDRLWYIQQDTAGINVFQRLGDMWRLLWLNDTCHLTWATHPRSLSGNQTPGLPRPATPVSFDKLRLRLTGGSHPEPFEG